MDKRVKIAYILFLFVFLFSVDKPIVNLRDMASRGLNTDIPTDIICYIENTPHDKDILFFSSPDGTLNWDSYVWNYMYSQYHMVPRVLHAYKTTPVEINNFDWFIAFNYPTETLANFLDEQNLEVVADCTPGLVLKRIKNS